MRERPPRAGRRRASAGAGTVLTLALLLAASACSANGPGDASAGGRGPTISATPATGLVDGQEVRLEGSGWAADAHYGVAMCQRGTSRCAVDEVDVATDAGGGIVATLAVDAAFVSWAGDLVDCRAGACELRVDTGTGVVAAGLAFDPDADLGPQPALTVRPAGGLADDQEVRVVAEHLDPGTHVAFALCRAGARSAFDDPCSPYDAGLLEEERPGLGWTVGEDGVVAADLHVRADAYAYERRVDCRVEQCEVVVTRSGAVLARTPISVERDARLRGPAELLVAPTAGVRAGERVEVRGSGFYADEPVLVEQCAAESTAETCVGGPSERWIADDDGRFAGTFTVRRHASTDHQPVDCLAVACVLRADRNADVPPLVRGVETPLGLDG